MAAYKTHRSVALFSIVAMVLSACGGTNANKIEERGKYSGASGSDGTAGDDKTPPEKVTGLTATAIGGFQISLDWNAAIDNSGAEGIAIYRLLRDGELLTEIVGTNISYTDSGLTPLTSYNYQVVAIDRAGNESPASDSVVGKTSQITGSDLYATHCSECHGDIGVSTKKNRTVAEIKASINNIQTMNHLSSALSDDQLNLIAQALSSLAKDSTPPAIVQGLKADALGPTSVGLSWRASKDNTNGSGLKGYRIFRDGTPVVDVDAAELGYTDTGLKAATGYAYTIAALDQAGNSSDRSAAIRVTTRTGQVGNDKTAPTRPTALVAMTISATRISLSWTAATDEDGGSGLKSYRIIRNGQFAREIPASGRSFTETNLTSNQTYTFSVIAVDNADNVSMPSESATANTTPADGVALYQTNCASCHGAIGATTKPNRSIATLTSAINFTPSMMGLNFLGADEIAAIVAATSTPTDTTPPSVPTGLTGVAGSSTRVDLRWTASTDSGLGVKGYRIYRNGVFVQEIQAPAVTAADPGMAPDTSYVYKINAVDVAGNVSGFTSDITVRTFPVSQGNDTTPPSVPTNLVATPLSHRTIRLSWQASQDLSGIKAYRITRNDIALPDVESPNLLLDDSGLSPETTYTYRILALDNAMNPSTLSTAVTGRTLAINGANLYAQHCASCHNALATSEVVGSTAMDIISAIATENQMMGISLTSQEIDAIAGALTPPPDTTPPTVPRNLTASPQTTSRIDLSWLASTDASGTAITYKLYRNDVMVRTVPAPGTSVSDTGLSANTTYKYEVSAIDAVGNESLKSAAVSAKTPATIPPTDTTPPSVPTNLVSVAAELTHKSVNLTWTASTDTGGSGVKEYRLERDGTQIAVITAPGTEYTDGGLTANTAYAYRIKSVDNANNLSALSAATTARTLAIDGVALYATNCASSSCHNTLANSNKRDRSAAQITGAIQTRSAMKDLQNLKDLTATEIAAIATALASPSDTQPPTVPSNLSGVAQSATAISLAWGASSDNVGVVGYKLYRNNALVKSGITDPATVDTGLVASTTYSYTVSAMDAAGNESSKTSAVSVTTSSAIPPNDTTPPSVPTQPVVSNLTYSSLTLTWAASTDNPGGTGVKQYKVFRNGAFYRSVQAPTTRLNDTGLAANTAYTYRVSALDAANESGQSLAVNTRTPAINGAALYAANCTGGGCHGPLASSSKRGSSLALVNSAIGGITPGDGIDDMNIPSLRALTVQEREAIVTALRPEPPLPGQERDEFLYDQPLGTRHLVASKLKASFLPAGALDADDNLIAAKINAVIEMQVGAIGAPCSRYDTAGTCLPESAMNVALSAPMLPLAHAGRRGYIRRACDEVLSINKSVVNALTNAGLTAASAANSANITRAYRLFYPQTAPTVPVVDALIAIHTQARTAPRSYSTTDAWRYVFTSICDSAGVDGL